MRIILRLLFFSLGVVSTVALAEDADQHRTAAQIFGAVPAVFDISLSPDGTKLAFIAPGPGKMTDLFAVDLSQANQDPVRVTRASGDPEDLQWCNWVTNARLVCQVGGRQEHNGEIYWFSNIVAINSDGSNARLLSKYRQKAFGSFSGGSVIDWLPDEEGSILMVRAGGGGGGYGWGVAKVDTISGKMKTEEHPRGETLEYISDGLGHVRIKGMRIKEGRTELDSGRIRYFYRPDGSDEWEVLSTLDYANRTGFNPYAVDSIGNRVFGFTPINGRMALVAIKLDGSKSQEVIFAHDQVDVDSLLRIGRNNRVVGVSYALEKREGEYFDPELSSLATALESALGNKKSINFIDSSQDETKLLIWAGADTDPGQYFLFDKQTKQMNPLLGVRPLVENQNLAESRPVSYPAADGTMIPAYLTLPRGGLGKNIPAIVMPHGGPEARDEWGFDWLAQFYASQGFAVMQPNFRGSSGYGDAWYHKNGFQGWRTSIGDVTDAGRWLISEGIAKPSALSIVGWSYGGYAALQSAVLAPDLFKAVVAIAPVTDLSLLKSESRGYYNGAVVREFIGAGSHIKEGSPAQNAAAIKAPVLLFHGNYDQNVDVKQSRLMESKLKDNDKSVQYYEYPKLAHGLHDARVRAEILQKSLDFLPK